MQKEVASAQAQAFASMNTGMAAEAADRIAAELVEIDLQIDENKATKQWFT